MFERFGKRYLIVGAACRPGEAGAGGCERRETELLEGARASGIPRVRHHEASGLMQPPKRFDPITHGAVLLIEVHSGRTIPSVFI